VFSDRHSDQTADCFIGLQCQQKVKQQLNLVVSAGPICTKMHISALSVELFDLETLGNGTPSVGPRAKPGRESGGRNPAEIEAFLLFQTEILTFPGIIFFIRRDTVTVVEWIVACVLAARKTGGLRKNWGLGPMTRA